MMMMTNLLIMIGNDDDDGSDSNGYDSNLSMKSKTLGQPNVWSFTCKYNAVVADVDGDCDGANDNGDLGPL